MIGSSLRRPSSLSTGSFKRPSPIPENIAKINRLYDEGNEIIIWTARGTVTKIDWRELTEKQLKEWGVKYHELKFGKPNYELLIDDKAINITDWSS